MPPKKTMKRTAPGKIQSTTDHDQFVFLELNRQIIWSHITKLKMAIEEKNLLHCQPIVVNEFMEVIDGQHRLIAAKKLKVPIYYMVVKGLTIEDAIILNITAATWDNYDYLRYYVKAGNPDYKKLQEFDADGHALGNSVGLLYERRAKASTEAMRNFRAGKFKVNNMTYALHFMEKARAIERYLPFDLNRDLLIALERAIKVDEFDVDKFIELVEEYPAEIKKSGDVINYLRDMEDLFNKNKHHRIRLF